MEQQPPAIEQILKAIDESRHGEIQRGELETLHNAGLLRAVLHGAPQYFHCVFINLMPKNSVDFVKIMNSDEFLNKHLPEQASLRLVPERFGIDVIISGHLPSKEWFKDKLYSKYRDYIQDWCQFSFMDTKRYRWKDYSNANSSLQPMIEPSVENAQRFLDADKTSTRLIYDLRKAPILSCYALIDSDLRYKNLWDTLGELGKNIRDIFYNPDGYEKGMNAGIITRSIIKSTSYVALCEFDNFKNLDGQISIDCAMNQSYDWRLKVLSLEGINQVRLIPCAVVKDSYDILDDVARLRGLEPSIQLRSVNPDVEERPKPIPFPVWSYLICGGKGGGKSVTAFYIMAEFLNSTPAYDVIFVNYKVSDERTDLGEKPSQSHEVVDYAGVIYQRTGKQTALVLPQDLKQELTQSKGSGAYYTEGCRGITVEFILEEIISAYEENKKNGSPRQCVIVFDEILNQEEKDLYMSSIADKDNQLRSLNIYPAVIGQQLTKIFEARGAKDYMIGSTVIVAGELLPGENVNQFKELLKRAPDHSEGDEAPLLKDVAEPKHGRFILLPRNNIKKETAVRIKTEKVTLRPEKDEKGADGKRMPEDWKWGTRVKDEYIN